MHIDVVRKWSAVWHLTWQYNLMLWFLLGGCLLNWMLYSYTGIEFLWRLQFALHLVFQNRFCLICLVISWPLVYFIPFKLWAKSLSQAKLFYAIKADVRNQGHKGILVGCLHNIYDLSQATRRKLAECCASELCEVGEDGHYGRSFWLPEHGYNGLLYWEGENVIVIVPDDGEIVTSIETILFYTKFLFWVREEPSLEERSSSGMDIQSTVSTEKLKKLKTAYLQNWIMWAGRLCYWS